MGGWTRDLVSSSRWFGNGMACWRYVQRIPKGFWYIWADGNPGRPLVASVDGVHLSLKGHART